MWNFIQLGAARVEYVGIFIFNPTARWNGRLRVRNGHSGHAHAPRTTRVSGQTRFSEARFPAYSRLFPATRK